MLETKTIKGSNVHNYIYYCVGVIFQFLNKIRHSWLGYTSPRTFSIKEYQKAIEYDFSVIKNWKLYLVNYLRHDETLQDKTILELGPGADLGVGLILLSYGCKKYNAMDINNLVKAVPGKFYEKLFKRLENDQVSKTYIDLLRQQLKLT